MYLRPNMLDPKDRLAHMLSEMDNDNAPIGWNQYRGLASLLLSKFPIETVVMDNKFFDPTFQPGKENV